MSNVPRPEISWSLRLVPNSNKFDMLKIFILTLSLLSCINTRKLIEGCDVVRFKEKAQEGNSSLLDYLLDVPIGGYLKKIKTGGSFVEYRIEYKDSSIIYIMNDNWGGSRLNYENRYNSNIKAINK